MIKIRQNSITIYRIDRAGYHFCNQRAQLGRFNIVVIIIIHRQPVTLTIGCSHNQDNRQLGQSGKCAIGQAIPTAMASVLSLE